MKKIAFALLVFGQPLLAQDFSEGSEAKPWNLFGEHPARFEAKVVDILCELTGDCPDNCGDGRRQLGLVRSADDALIFPNKNSQPAFTGAVEEMLPFCGKEVEVDGLMIDDPDVGAKNIYLLQKIRETGDDNWTKANSWTKKWAEANPEQAKIKGPWFRHDPDVNAKIAETGYFGLGHEADQKYFEENF
jgi:hypothetical protein